MAIAAESGAPGYVRADKFGEDGTFVSLHYSAVKAAVGAPSGANTQLIMDGGANVSIEASLDDVTGALSTARGLFEAPLE